MSSLPSHDPAAGPAAAADAPWLSQLNDVQRAAVRHTDGPVMIIAGPGSGKTRVLTYRIAHLMHLGVDPFRILALTFTNKAAREMKERIAQVRGTDARNLWMGTFHSVFARILRIDGERLGYPSNFTIYDTQDTKSLLKTIVKELGLNDKLYKPSTVYGRISSSKNALIGPAEYAANPMLQADDESAGRPRMAEVYRTYVKRCFRAGAMDFDDLLFNTHKLFAQHPDVLVKYQHRFSHVMIDEFQDTNEVQYAIVRQLAEGHQNIAIVGDDAQSIYAFRGATIANILNFERDFPDTTVYKLEQNYRSTKVIVEAANEIIRRNRDQLAKAIWTDNSDGGKIKVIRAMSDNEEGKLVGEIIFELKMREKLRNRDFAILYRTNAQSRALEEALRRLNIPYRIYGGVSFFQRKEVKDLLAYLKVIVNPQDEESLRRIINYPARGIGKTTIDRMTVLAEENDCTLWDIAENASGFGLGRSAGAVEQFILMMRAFMALSQRRDAYALAEHVAKQTGMLKELYNDKSVEGLSRYENFQELLNAIKEFTEEAGTASGPVDAEPADAGVDAPSAEDGVDAPGAWDGLFAAGGPSAEGPAPAPEPPAPEEPADPADALAVPEDRSLGAYLQQIVLLTDADEEGEDEDRVKLMTIHAAKGLEFPVVFSVGLEENLFPSLLSLNSREDLEEERRLFYVAVTRAEKHLYLSHAASRYKFGQLIYSEPSRFLEELPERVLEHIGTRKAKPTAPPSGAAKEINRQRAARRPEPTGYVHTPTPGFLPSDPASLRVGSGVEHQRFGFGKITAMEGSAPNQMATIAFDQLGEKKLLLKFAKLRVADPA